MKAFIGSVGFIGSKLDTSLFVRVNDDVHMYVLVYIDYIIITGSDQRDIEQFMTQLKAEFSLKDLGDLHYFLGIEVT